MKTIYSPHCSPNDATAICKNNATRSKPTPQEIQQRIYCENLEEQKQKNMPPCSPGKNDITHNDVAPDQNKIDPSVTAVVASIKAGTPFIVFIDDGAEVRLSASKISQPAVLGILVKFVHQLTVQDNVRADHEQTL